MAELKTTRGALRNVTYLILIIFIVENTSEKHENRIAELEKKLAETNTTFDYRKTVINSGGKSVSKSEELANELKHLSDRVEKTKGSLDTLVRKRNDGVSTAQTTETIEDNEEETPESLENQLQAIKTRLSRVEDTNGKSFLALNFLRILIIEELLQALEKNSNNEGEDANSNHSDEVEKEIKELKIKIKEIEDRLRELKGGKSVKILPNSSKDDYSTFMYDLNDRLEKLEESHDKTVETVTNHTERIEKLEKDNESNNKKIASNKQDIGEIKDSLPDKVDCETFDTEITYIKELLNQLAGDKEIDMSKFAPPQAAGLSTKDANKLKDLAAKVPELEKLINDILQRLGQAERDIQGHDKSLKKHDKSIEELWAELSKKANVNDLKDLLDRMNQLEKDLANVVNHLNSLGNTSGTPAPVVVSGGSDDKRLKKLEEKVEDLRNHVSNSIRDINKTMDSLNSEVKGVYGELKDQKKDFLKLVKRVNDLELKLDALLKRGQQEATTVQVSGIDNDKLEDLKQQLNELRNDYRSFKNEVLNQFNTVSKELDKKASKEDLENLRNLLQNRLDDLEKSLNKTKNDLKRALRILNDKVGYNID